MSCCGALKSSGFGYGFGFDGVCFTDIFGCRRAICVGRRRLSVMGNCRRVRIVLIIKPSVCLRRWRRRGIRRKGKAGLHLHIGSRIGVDVLLGRNISRDWRTGWGGWRICLGFLVWRYCFCFAHSKKAIINHLAL